MKALLKMMILAGAITFGASAAIAEEGDKYSFILGSILVPDSAFDQDDGWAAQLGLGREMNDFLNVEGYLRSSRAKGDPSFANSVLGVDLQFVFARDQGFEPYLFFGLGHRRSSVEGLPSKRGKMLDGGAGFRARIFGDSDTSLRVEYRYSNYDSHDLKLDDQFYSIGVQMPFGEKPAPAPVLPAKPAPAADTDGDGVNDNMDQCPNTPAGVSVDSRGCALDGDGDGVADHMDQCPGTERGAVVDEKGCELDGDSDGVVDRLDDCPNSAPGVQVDINGCEIKEEIKLPGVNFESNSDRLLPGAESVLNDAAATLRKNPEIKVEVAGYTDSDGAADYNESLSTRRAATVRDFLAGRGVEMDRMTVRGYGEAQPIADNATSVGKATNRRVVLRITER